MKAKTILTWAAVLGLIYLVWKLVPTLTSRLQSSGQANTSAAPYAGPTIGDQYAPWMQPTAPVPDYYYIPQQGPSWKTALAQAGAQIGQQAADYYFPVDNGYYSDGSDGS